MNLKVQTTVYSGRLNELNGEKIVTVFAICVEPV